ncbi:MAG: HAD-IA family hydrolase [Myxococcota bacterium]
MTIRAVVFDATGTLIEPRESVGTVYARAALAEGIRLPAWRLDDAFVRVLRASPPLAAAAASGVNAAERAAAETAWWIDRVRQVFQATDSTVEFRAPKAFALSLFETYRRPESWRERPGARALLEALSRAGLRLGLASNFDHRLPEILEGLDLIGFFDAVEIPSRRGRAKPDRAVFEALGEALSAGLDELAYVGDDTPEVLAAIAALGVRIFDVRALTDLGEVASALEESGA